MRGDEFMMTNFSVGAARRVIIDDCWMKLNKSKIQTKSILFVGLKKQFLVPISD